MNAHRCAILAAGNSTRLPNKILLPTPDGIVIDSAANFGLLHVKSQFLHLVLKPDSTIEAVMAQRVEEEGCFGEIIHQYYARGVCEAMKLCHEFDHDADWLFLLGDNFFSTHCNLFSFADGNRSYVGVVDVKHIHDDDLAHLDGYNRQEGEWVRRGAHMDYVIAGGYLIRAADLDQCKWDGDLIQYLNRINAGMHELDESGRWTDLGTPESYIRFWKGER